MRYKVCVLAAGLLLAGVIAGACASGSGGTGAASGARPTGPASAAPSGGAPDGDPLGPLPPLPGKVNLSYSSVTSNYAPFYIAADQGLFAKNGLDVEVTLITSGTTSLQSLIAGDIHFSVTSGAEPATAYVHGAPVRIVAGWARALGSLFMVDPSITSPEQLKGKPVGITRFGGLPHVAARLALKKWGMDPDNDVQYLQMGGTPEILAGMQTGAVVGGAYAPPTNIRAQRLGFRVLGDLSKMDIPYQSSVMASTPSYLDANPEVTRRVVRALLEGIKISVTDDETTLAAVARFTRMDEPELLNEALVHYRAALAKIPYPWPEGLQTVLDEVAESEPRARTVRPQEFIDTRALEQLEREGFVKALWGEESPR